MAERRTKRGTPRDNGPGGRELERGEIIAPPQSVSVVGLREGAEVFGGPEPGEPVRVEMQVRMCLSFAEILGLLLYTPGLSLMFEELEDGDAVRDSLQFALIETSLCAMEINAAIAEEEYREALAGRGKAPLFVRMLAETVTRLFGVTA
ncbi:hypothetical protein [Streptomyces thermocarboxydovorans]|uniref:hypothetical protein n=1 Tax=Streptomyces thermocarboxydovorans TaxID=59298 RepID=UPI0031DA730A